MYYRVTAKDLALNESTPTNIVAATSGTAPLFDLSVWNSTNQTQYVRVHSGSSNGPLVGADMSWLAISKNSTNSANWRNLVVGTYYVEWSKKSDGSSGGHRPITPTCRRLPSHSKCIDGRWGDERAQEERGGQSGLSLVELLIAMAIMGVISTMVLMVWFSLQDSYAFTSRSDKQREFARDATARMTREIRDIQAQAGLDAVVVADANEFWVYSAFNLPNQIPTDKPRGTRYTYDPATNTIYRQRDRSADADQSPLNEPKVAVANNVVNDQVASIWGASTPVFTYVVYDGAGNQVPTTSVSGSAMQSISSALRSA